MRPPRHVAVLRRRTAHLPFRVEYGIPWILASLNLRHSADPLIHQVPEAARSALIICPSNLDDSIVSDLVLIGELNRVEDVSSKKDDGSRIQLRIPGPCRCPVRRQKEPDQSQLVLIIWMVKTLVELIELNVVICARGASFVLRLPRAMTELPPGPHPFSVAQPDVDRLRRVRHPKTAA